MARERGAAGRIRIVVLVVASLAAGSLLGGSAVAHTGKKLGHLLKHLDSIYLNEGQQAIDSALLDGLDSTAFVQGAAQHVRTLSCPGTDFFPVASNIAYTSFNGERYSSTASGGLFRCGVSLPHAATVTSVSWYLYDGTGSSGIPGCDLMQSSFTAPAPTSMASTTGTSVADAAGYYTFTDDAITSGVVDNTDSAYSLQCDVDSSSDDARLVAATITYEVSSADG
jgi:hypothetical protein